MVEYRIERIGDLLDVPHDALERLIPELVPAIYAARMAYEAAKLCGEDSCGAEFLTCLRLVDDGEHDITVTVNGERVMHVSGG